LILFSKVSKTRLTLWIKGLLDKLEVWLIRLKYIIKREMAIKYKKKLGKKKKNKRKNNLFYVIKYFLIIMCFIVLKK